MSTNPGDYGHPCSCFFLPIGLTDVNNVIIYYEFSSFHDGSQCFHILLILPLTPCLVKQGVCAASFGHSLRSRHADDLTIPVNRVI